MSVARGRRWALACALAALALACNSTSRRLDEANAARHAGRTHEALKGYQDVLAELGEGRLDPERDDLRLRALKYAADVSYLELGDFSQAIGYYRRIVALYPGTEDAWRARAATGDIYRDRFHDPLGAIAQWADIAGGDGAEAAEYQLRVARAYLELKNYEQARTEARLLRERWPTSLLAEEAQLLTGQAWALEQRGDEAFRAFEALVESNPRPELTARALEAQAYLAAQQGKLDRAIELYERALPLHPNPETIRLALDKVRTRRARSRTSAPGDRATAFDQNVRAKDAQQEIP